MITKSIGVGGDYKDIGTAWLSLPPLLTDSYMFNQISDFTETTGVPDIGGQIFGGYTVEFKNSKYKIFTSLVYHFRIDGIATSHSDIIILNGLDFVLTSSFNGVFLNIAPWISTKTITAKYLNCKITGFSSFSIVCTAIQLVMWGSENIIQNCNISNIWNGINASLSADGNTTGHLNTIENCTIRNCTNGIILGVSTQTLKYMNVTNTVVTNCSTKCFVPGSIYNTITNCADSDNSIASSGAILNNNITGITASDFVSVNPASNDFLKIDSSSHLFQTGTTNISSWNTSDYEGDPRPNSQGKVSIGFDEPLIPSTCWNFTAMFKGTKRFFKMNGPGDCPAELQVPKNVDLSTGIMMEHGKRIKFDKFKVL